MRTEAYIDESGTGDSDPVHCLAGYIVKPGLSPAMAIKWQRVLDRFGIPFFHMTDCAAYEHCEPYKGLGRDKCIQLATELIKLIKKYCLHGFAVCLSPRFYSVYADPNVKSQDPYPFSVGLIHYEVQEKLKFYEFDGEVSYIFEAGHRHQKRARAVLGDLLAELDKIQYSTTFAFKTKIEAILLQAADILAWHCQTHVKRKMKGQKTRRDFLALTEIPHTIYHLYNPFSDGVKDTETTVIAIDFDPHDSGESFDRLIDAVYVKDEPVPQ